MPRRAMPATRYALMCASMRSPTRAQSLAQYVSLALYLGPPPALAPTVDEGDLPAEADQVVGVLPLLRSFADAIHLNALWFEHRAEYDGFVDRIHDPLTKMVLGTDLYLHLPVSSYDGRRFIVLLEPMLAPSQTNARISDSDFIVVVSPAKEPAAIVPMDLIRHTYLHYEIEPLVNGHTASLNRLLPLLKPVQQSALDYSYKSDIVALVTECLIKAVELHLEDTGIALPAKPDNLKERADTDQYDGGDGSLRPPGRGGAAAGGGSGYAPGLGAGGVLLQPAGGDAEGRDQPEGLYRADGVWHGCRPRGAS